MYAERQMIRNNIKAYGDWMRWKMHHGWTGIMITMVHEQIHGGARRLRYEFNTTIDKVYGTLLTRMYRKPRKIPVYKLPILITANDWPVFKHSTISLERATINDGMHQHGMLMIPPAPSRLVSVYDDLVTHQSKYISGTTLSGLHAMVVVDDIEFVTDYALKGWKQLSKPENDLIVLPRLHSEMTDQVGQ